MGRVAIFVDAGYLFAQGSTALNGQKAPRTELILNDAAIIRELEKVAGAKCPNLPILRIYWYDGASPKTGPTVEHARLAHTDGVKVRLGFLNSVGQQKGVDSLIVTDLVELARNAAVCEAILVSGDEDVRIGVQIAQSLGVRVHLVGIAPSRGSQSKLLMQEADSTTEWDRSVICQFLSMRPQRTQVAVAAPSSPAVRASVAKPNGTPAAAQRDSTPAAGKATIVGDSSQILALVVDQLFAELQPADLAGAAASMRDNNSIPREYDGKLLARSRDTLARDLTPQERATLRGYFRQRLRERQPSDC
jgi:uncharacterized LabA/DUF88 family protein